MRWLITLGFLVLIVALTYYLVFADRSFDSYYGAERGMSVGAAAQNLKLGGWTLLSSSSAIENANCDGKERYYFVQLRSPDYLLTLAVDSDCNVSSIARQRSGIEL